jgi:hypothetical protein
MSLNDTTEALLSLNVLSHNVESLYMYLFALESVEYPHCLYYQADNDKYITEEQK